jgi:hypothetical protein
MPRKKPTKILRRPREGNHPSQCARFIVLANARLREDERKKATRALLLSRFPGGGAVPWVSAKTKMDPRLREDDAKLASAWRALREISCPMKN